MSQAPGSPSEEVLLAAIERELAKSQRIDQRIRAGDFGVEAGSDLEGDASKLAGLYDPSETVRRSIATAVSHCKAIYEALLIDGHGWLNSYYPLVRAVLENAALAHWLVVPDSQEERCYRQILVGWTDLEEDRKSWTPGCDPQSQTYIAAMKERDDKKANAESLAVAIGKPLPPNPQLHYVDPVKSLPISANFNPPETIWRVCSGMAHGKTWAFQLLSGTQGRFDRPDGGYRATFNLDLHALLVCVGVAVYALEQAVKLFDHRRSAPESTAE